MNKCIPLLITLWCLGVSSVCAQYKQVYSNYLDTDKIIIKFHSHLDENAKNELLNQITGIQDWGFLTYPHLTIAQTTAQNTTEYYQIIDQIKQLSDVDYVGVYFKNDQDQCLGILNQTLVQLRKPSDIHLLEAAVDKYQLKSIVPHRTKNVYELHFDKNATIDAVDLAITLNQSGKFAYAEPNYLLNPIVTTNDSLFNYQWAINNTGSAIQYNGTLDADMDVDDAWTITTGESYVRVAVLDSGTDTLHPDLIGNLATGYSTTGDGSKGYPTFSYSSDGHGTCCAGIIAAKGNNNIGIAGVAYNSTIIPIKVFVYQNIPFVGVTPYSTASRMADGITWAWQVGKADILSNSWGLANNFIPLLPGPGDTSTVNTAIAQAYANGRDGKGSLLFFSSGNDGDPPIWPSREPHAISVNATSMCDQRKMAGSCDGESWEGNWGNPLELGAPGVKVATTDATGSNGYNNGEYSMTFNGTSAACPNAAAVMALILSVDSSLTADQAREIIDTTAEKVGGYNYTIPRTYGMWSNELGYGRVNAYQAVLAAQGTPVFSPEVQAQTHFEVYPNPAQNSIIVSHKLQNDQALQISIYTALGQQVMLKTINSDQQTEINTSLLPNGAYYISLETAKTVVSKKIHILR
ncbi:MAG: S8 family serine peptidase [Aureispira sp.]|nr:S8 family serine peptidase [Aureispira sp.]